MELNDSVKNGDVETAWDSSEVGENAEIEYVPLMRVDLNSTPLKIRIQKTEKTTQRRKSLPHKG